MLSIETRRRWIEVINEACGLTRWKHLATLYARSAEKHAYFNCQKRITIEEGVVVCRYGDVDMLDIDFTRSHQEAAINTYSKLLRRAVWIVAQCNLEYLESTFGITLAKGKALEAIFNAEDEILTEKTLHAKWEDDFYASQNFARSVLKGTGEKPQSGIFACRRCKSFDVDTEQKQTRSADEPMTIFCTCNACGKRFIH
jgi:DNA-directed RNA polymerase subunit M/transcription elongation factor TFIIS